MKKYYTENNEKRGEVAFLFTAFWELQIIVAILKLLGYKFHASTLRKFEDKKWVENCFSLHREIALVTYKSENPNIGVSAEFAKVIGLSEYYWIEDNGKASSINASNVFPLTDFSNMGHSLETTTYIFKRRLLPEYVIVDVAVSINGQNTSLVQIKVFPDGSHEQVGEVNLGTYIEQAVKATMRDVYNK